MYNYFAFPFSFMENVHTTKAGNGLSRIKNQRERKKNLSRNKPIKLWKELRNMNINKHLTSFFPLKYAKYHDILTARFSFLLPKNEEIQRRHEAVVDPSTSESFYFIADRTRRKQKRCLFSENQDIYARNNVTTFDFLFLEKIYCFDRIHL